MSGQSPSVNLGLASPSRAPPDRSRGRRFFLAIKWRPGSRRPRRSGTVVQRTHIAVYYSPENRSPLRSDGRSRTSTRDTTGRAVQGGSRSNAITPDRSRLSRSEPVHRVSVPAHHVPCSTHVGYNERSPPRERCRHVSTDRIVVSSSHGGTTVSRTHC